ncbi:MAG: hypothetical protein CM1200mP27_02020 [Chloroflexota bacterium]|nr:MAG: hypothetical protein CM1200mP27_02020 [Chloroflexota bacterium]
MTGTVKYISGVFGELRNSPSTLLRPDPAPWSSQLWRGKGGLLMNGTIYLLSTGLIWSGWQLET